MNGPTRRQLAAAALGAAAMARIPDADAADAAGCSAEGIYRFRLGRFAVTMLLDASPLIEGPWPIVGEGQQRAEMAALMRENRLPPDRFRPGFTPVLVETGQQRVLFDTGNGAVGFVPRPAGGRLRERLMRAGCAPDSIDLVVLTHCHTDHIGGLMEAGMCVFPNARIIVGASEHAFWSTDAPLAAPPESNEHTSALMFRSHLLALRGRTDLITAGAEVIPGITALAAGGHTPGHLAFHVESEGRRLLIWGDCAHHEVASLARPDWHALFDMDKDAGAVTRRRIYDMAASEDLVVAGYHTSFPSLGYVVRAGAAYRWIPVTYQLEL
ncbi:MBL fold metallo-hydrolase [Methylobacterium durans]|uniref:MBL fold metallo-hydrolase n=1 Tax=Methylobacterium durans TaxID=2202825 RepID=UPI003C6D45B1